MSSYDLDILPSDDYGYSDDFFWEEFQELLDDGNDFPREPHYHFLQHSSTLTPGDLAEQPDLYREIRTPTEPNYQHRQEHRQQQTNMPNGRYSSPSTPRRRRHNDEESLDPWRPFSRDSNGVIDLTDDSPPLQMGKRKLSGAAATAHAAKKQRLSSSRSTSGETTTPPKAKLEPIDLTEVDSGVPDWETTKKREKREKEALEAQKAIELAESRAPKLAKFECVICLETPTNLVVTYCGHLFCAECLHNALDTSPGGSRCPSCRSKIVISKHGTGKESKMTYYPLEIQMKVSSKSGKRKAS